MDADRLARKKAARKRRLHAEKRDAAIESAVDAMMEKMGEGITQAARLAPANGDWTICTNCGAATNAHVTTPCPGCRGYVTMRFTDGVFVSGGAQSDGVECRIIPNFDRCIR